MQLPRGWKASRNFVHTAHSRTLSRGQLVAQWADGIDGTDLVEEPPWLTTGTLCSVPPCVCDGCCISEMPMSWKESFAVAGRAWIVVDVVHSPCCKQSKTQLWQAHYIFHPKTAGRHHLQCLISVATACHIGDTYSQIEACQPALYFWLLHGPWGINRLGVEFLSSIYDVLNLTFRACFARIVPTDHAMHMVSYKKKNGQLLISGMNLLKYWGTMQGNHPNIHFRI